MATFTEFINRLHANTGLNIDVITAWVNRERGVNNNVLGVTSGGSLVKYPNQTVGADATANLLKSSSMYQGIINSTSGTSQQQALAIAQSPWHLGLTGLRAAGGTDPYYMAGFVQAGILSNSSLPGGGASTPITPSPNSAFLQKLSSLGISTDSTHKITQSESDLIATNLYNVDPKLFGSSLVGKTVADLSQGGSINFDPIGATGNFLKSLDVQAAITFVGVILVGITLILTGGIISLKGKQ